MHPSSRVNMQKAIDSIKNTFPNDMLILDVGGRNVGGETTEHDRSYKYMFRSYKEYYVCLLYTSDAADEL